MPDTNSPSEAQNQDEKETQETAPAQAVEGEGTDTSVVDDVKKDEQADPYQKQVEELQSEIAKKEKIISQKERALQALKKKSKDQDATQPEEEVSQIDELRTSIAQLQTTLEERLGASELDQEIMKLTDNPTERDAVKLHYKHSIARSGNLVKDIRAAFAIANQDMVFAMKSGEASEEVIARYQSSDVRGRSPDKRLAEPKARAIAAELEKRGMGTAKKYI